MSDIPRLLDSILSKPLLVQPSYLNTALEVLRLRNYDVKALAEQSDQYQLGIEDAEALTGQEIGYDARYDEGKRYIDDGIATINVMGALHQRQMAGLSSSKRGYNGIAKDFDAAMADDRVQGVMLNFDTPGGVVTGLQGLTEKIRSYRGFKPIGAVVNEAMFSAGYWLGSAADTIYMPPTAYTGSIGVVMAHHSFERALDEAGIKVTLIHAGDHKVDGNAYTDLPDDVRNRLQAEVNRLYATFTQAVASNRGLQPQAVIDTQARTYNAEDAVGIGLADTLVGSADEAFEMFRERVKGGATRITTSTMRVTGVSDKPEKTALSAETPTFTQAELDAQVSATLAESEKAHAQELSVAAEAGAQAERDRIFGIIDHEAAEGRLATALAFARSGMTVEQAATALPTVPKVAAAQEDDGIDALGTAIAATKTGNDDVSASLGSEDDVESYEAAGMRIANAYKATSVENVGHRTGGKPYVG